VFRTPIMLKLKGYFRHYLEAEIYFIICIGTRGNCSNNLIVCPSPLLFMQSCYGTLAFWGGDAILLGVRNAEASSSNFYEI
jgi:hypothetical protein